MWYFMERRASFQRYDFSIRGPEGMDVIRELLCAGRQRIQVWPCPRRLVGWYCLEI
jgi:hypothetical protein